MLCRFSCEHQFNLLAPSFLYACIKVNTTSISFVLVYNYLYIIFNIGLGLVNSHLIFFNSACQRHVRAAMRVLIHVGGECMQVCELVAPVGVCARELYDCHRCFVKNKYGIFTYILQMDNKSQLKWDESGLLLSYETQKGCSCCTPIKQLFVGHEYSLHICAPSQHARQRPSPADQRAAAAIGPWRRHTTDSLLLMWQLSCFSNKHRHEYSLHICACFVFTSRMT